MEAYSSTQLLQLLHQVSPVITHGRQEYPYSAISVDSLLTGVHFPEDTRADWIAHKALAVNLSDLASMGAVPLTATLGLTVPTWDDAWIEQFVDGFQLLQSTWGLRFAACDVRQGPLSITIQVEGGLQQPDSMLRSAAQVGDLVFVTNTIGDAACALSFLLNKKPIPSEYRCILEQRLHQPSPRVDIGLCLSGLANAAIDVSDGLAADIGHIAEKSQVAIEIDLDSLPASSALRALSSDEQRLNFQLAGGDDYELCFTVATDKCREMEKRLSEINAQYSLIGKTTRGEGIHYLKNGQRVEMVAQGFDHFKQG